MQSEIISELLREDIMPSMRFFLSRAGQFSPLCKMTQELRTTAHRIYREGLALSEPSVAAAMIRAEELAEHLIPDPLKRASHISLFCATLGERLDEAIDSLFQRDKPLDGSLLDAWGSEAVEQLAQNIDVRLRARYGMGSMRFSPGYGNFSVLYNAELLPLLLQLDSAVSVSVSDETGILSPRKSVLCMIGWGEFYSEAKSL